MARVCIMRCLGGGPGYTLQVPDLERLIDLVNFAGDQGYFADPDSIAWAARMKQRLQNLVDHAQE